MEFIPQHSSTLPLARHLEATSDFQASPLLLEDVY